MRVHVALLASAFVLAAAAASAQTPGQRPAPPQAVEGWTPTAPQVTTSQTADPWQQFAPLPTGLAAGGFKVYPSVTAGAFFDDNVFATHSNRQGSWGGLVRPELGLVTTGQTYAVEARGFIEDRWYSRFSSEDQVNGAAGLASTVMLDNDTQLVGKARYVHAHENRGVGESQISPTFDKPVAYNTFDVAGALNKRFNRWWTSLGGAATWIHYDNPTIGGVPVDQSYRNGDVEVVSGRLGYVVAPLTSIFVEVSGNRRNFQVDAFDSRGWRAVGGVLLEPGPGARVKGEAYAGYMFQDYTGATFNTVSTITYGGALAWLIAPRWTATVYGSRNALESGLINNGVMGVSLIESTVAGRLDYLVMTNLIIGAGASYVADEFLGAGRTHAISPLVSVKYLVNPYLTLGFDYRNVSFDSSGLGVPTYYRNVYLFSLNARI